MPIKIPSLPSIPGGTISGQTSIPVSKTTTDPKTYKMTLDQTLSWIQANGGGGGGGGSQGAQGNTGNQGGTGSQGSPGTAGTSGYQGGVGPQGFSGFSGWSGFQGFQGHSGYQGVPGGSGYQGFIGPQGFTGVSGYQGIQGSMGSNTGQPGPGLVYTGYYRGTSAVYFNTTTRKDVASYDSGSGLVYWLANSTSLTATSGASGWGVPGVDSAWSNFGQEFKSVATGLLLTEDAAVTKTITLGEVSNLSAGIIRSANCNNFGDGNGFWMGNDAQGRVGFFVGNSSGPSYLAYDSSVGSLALSGTIYATAGKIAGLGIADYSYSGGSSGTVLYTGNPLTPGTSSTPLFINARASGAYGNGEVILGLGNRLVYYYDNGNYYAQLSGTIYANAGSIGGVGISEGIIYTGSPSGAGTSATPFYLNGTISYAPGEILFSLGNRMVFAVDPDNTTLTSLVLSGNITADAGSIGGIGIGYYNNGSGNGSVLYSGVYNTPGTSATPIFINGRAAGTYAHNEIIFGLGSTLTYRWLSAGGGTYSAKIEGEIIANAGSFGGVYIGSGYIYSGVGTYSNPNTPFYVNSSNGRFSLGNALIFDGTTLTISGNVQTSATSALSAAISDVNAKIWTDNTGKLVAPAASAVKSGSGLYLGPQQMGYWNGSTWKTYMDYTGNFYLNGTGDQSLLWNGSALTINGSISAVGGKFYAGDSGRTSYLEWDTSTLTLKGVEAADGITITSGLGLRFYNNSGSFTITGGTGNGSQYGAQIDLVGNDFGGSGQGGQLVLQAGEGVGSTIALHTNYAANVSGTHRGVQRMIVWSDGLVQVKRASTILGYNDNAGNLVIDGNVGIGTNPSSSNAGTGNLDATGDITAASFNTTSSRRYKKNITPIKDPLKTINKLQGVTFDWNNKKLTNDIGLIAEEVEYVLPTLVHKNPDKPEEVVGLDYGRITALLIETVKELNRKIEVLEKR